nr:IDEAL domain-containing protein [Neobacillus sp. Marseille-Q6967]
MKKSGCKTCGSSEFFVMGSGQTLCKCGKPIQDPQKKPKTSYYKTQAELIAKISLLKRNIDKCLDERDEEGFNKYVFELKVCQRYLKTRMNYSNSGFKERLEGKFLNKEV